MNLEKSKNVDSRPKRLRLTSHMKKVSLYEAKANLSKLVKTAAEARRNYLVTVRGKPMAGIIPIEDNFTPLDVWKER